MDYNNSPFHRFFGWQILALAAVFQIYTMWYTGPGPFGQLADLAPGMPMQEQFFYSGQQAVDTYAGLDNAGRRTTLLALLLDIPFMILFSLLAEALIAFGIRQIKLGGKWNLLFVLPIAFLLCDFGEDSFLALTLTSGNTILGSIAGVFTAMKFVTFFLAIIFAIAMAIGGLVAFLRRRSSPDHMSGP